MTFSSSSSAPDWLGLRDRVCVVTGGGNGIGAETARELARAGARVAVLDRDDTAAAAVAAEIVRAAGCAIGICADIGQPDSVAAAAKRVEQELGACRVLVNNAAVRHREPVLDLSIEAWNRVLTVNLTGALVCSQAFAAQMVAAGQGGSLVHVASLIAHFPQGGSAAYCASKAAMLALSKSLAIELGPHRIRSNVASPGQIRTPANDAVYRDDPQLTAARERAVPTGRIGTPSDLANLIAFLASDRSGYINAQEIVVDGGLNSTLMETNKRPLPAR